MGAHLKIRRDPDAALSTNQDPGVHGRRGPPHFHLWVMGPLPYFTESPKVDGRLLCANDLARRCVVAGVRSEKFRENATLAVTRGVASGALALRFFRVFFAGSRLARSSLGFANP